MPIAFFDMDKTLLKVSSGTEYVKWFALRGNVSLRELWDTLRISIAYKRGVMDFPDAMARMGHRIKNGSVEATHQLSQQFFESKLRPAVAPIAVARLRKHQEDGDMVYMLTASTQFVAEPVARYLDIPYRCTVLETDGDCITGAISGEPCFGTGKIHWARSVCDEQHASLTDAFFYTDSINDLPLLEHVGHPVAVNPDRKLKRQAKLRNWPVAQFY